MNRLNVNRLAEVLSDILTQRHGAKITVTMKPMDANDDRRKTAVSH